MIKPDGVHSMLYNEYNVVSDSGEISNKQKHVADEYLDQQSCGIIKTQQSGNFASKSYHLVEQI